jgi:peptidyl-prolyl cis-trans isomerase SurA
LACPGLGAEVLNRVVAAIGNAALTQSDVLAEYRLESFLKTGRIPDSAPDAATFNQVRDRLIAQKLLGLEADAEDFRPADSAKAATGELETIRGKFANDRAFQAALATLGMDQPQLLDRLAEQDRTLRLIDEHLRPSASVSAAEIQDYYDKTFLPDYRRQNPASPPPLADVESQIREILVQQKIDQLLPAWLERLRSADRVRIVS